MKTKLTLFFVLLFSNFVYSQETSTLLETQIPQSSTKITQASVNFAATGNMLDNNLDSGWVNGVNPSYILPSSFVVDLGDVYKISKIVPRSKWPEGISDYTLSFSEDGITFGDERVGTRTAKDAPIIFTTNFPSGRFIKLLAKKSLTNSSYLYVHELTVFSTDAEPPPSPFTKTFNWDCGFDCLGVIEYDIFLYTITESFDIISVQNYIVSDREYSITFVPGMYTIMIAAVYPPPVGETDNVYSYRSNKIDFRIEADGTMTELNVVTPIAPGNLTIRR